VSKWAITVATGFGSREDCHHLASAGQLESFQAALAKSEVSSFAGWFSAVVVFWQILLRATLVKMG